MAAQQRRTRKLTIIAQDPSIRVREKILRTQIEIPAEELQPAHWGRVQTLDFDSSTGGFIPTARVSTASRWCQ